MISIAIYDKEFQRQTYLGKVISFYIKEKRSTYGDFTIWLENDIETNQYIKEGNFVVFQHKIEEVSNRNFITSGSRKYGVVKNGNEFLSLNVQNAYPLSSMASYSLVGNTVTISCSYETLTDLELASNAQIWLQLQYIESGVTKYLNVQCESEILTNLNGVAFATVNISSIDAMLQQINVIMSGVNGTVNIYNSKLEIGGVNTNYVDAPESDFSYIGLDNSSGIISEVSFEDEEAFTGVRISGNLCEGFLEDRCLYGLFQMSASPISVCNQMVIENFVNPEDAERNYEIVDIAGQPEDNSEVIHFQKTGFQIADSVTSIALQKGLGIKAIFDRSMKKIHFYMYKGKDRSVDQIVNPRIIFSDENGLMINPKYLEDYKLYKNVARIAGQGEGEDRVFTVVGTATGRDRKELYIDARDLSNKLQDQTEMSPEDYIAILQQRGQEKLAVLQPVTSFESDVNIGEGTYIYGIDFTIGDTVTLYHSTTGIRMNAIIEEVHFIGDSEGDEMSIVFGYAPPSIATLIKSRIG